MFHLHSAQACMEQSHIARRLLASAEAAPTITRSCRSDPFVQSSKERVMAAAREILVSGLSSQSQADVASALQIFFNAGCLKKVLPPSG